MCGAEGSCTPAYGCQGRETNLKFVDCKARQMWPRASQNLAPIWLPPEMTTQILASSTFIQAEGS